MKLFSTAIGSIALFAAVSSTAIAAISPSINETVNSAAGAGDVNVIIRGDTAVLSGHVYSREARSAVVAAAKEGGAKNVINHVQAYTN